MDGPRAAELAASDCFVAGIAKLYEQSVGMRQVPLVAVVCLRRDALCLQSWRTASKSGCTMVLARERVQFHRRLAGPQNAIRMHNIGILHYKSYEA